MTPEGNGNFLTSGWRRDVTVDAGQSANVVRELINPTPEALRRLRMAGTGVTSCFASKLCHLTISVPADSMRFDFNRPVSFFDDQSM